jgi:periplasmic divalent cation tolerance protein
MSAENPSSPSPTLSQRTDAVVVLVTWPADRDPVELAHALVTERLAACVNVLGPVRSIYQWKGDLEDGTELQLIVKSRASALPRLFERVRALHPYEVPEFLVLPVASGSTVYLEWINRQVGG